MMERGPHGVLESNPLPPGYHDEQPVGTLAWDDPDLVRIERLRLLSDPGFPVWDVSYCTGRNKLGQKVKVDLPFDQLPKGKGPRGFMATLIRYAKRDRVYLKRLGVFDAISKLV